MAAVMQACLFSWRLIRFLLYYKTTSVVPNFSPNLCMTQHKWELLLKTIPCISKRVLTHDRWGSKITSKLYFCLQISICLVWTSYHSYQRLYLLALAFCLTEDLSVAQKNFRILAVHYEYAADCVNSSA